MPTAKQFIDAIETEGLVPEAVIQSLHAEFKASGGAITAEDLAKRLVTFGAITQDQADLMLMSSGDSFRMQASGKKPEPIAKPAPFDDPDEEPQRQDAPSAPKRKKHVKKTSPKGFDSPLILIGGGALVLLMLCGGGVFFLLNQQSGDDLLEAADKAYKSRAYSQAITEYERYVEKFSGHEGWSRARVQLVIAKLRQAVDTARDEELALELAQAEIPRVEDERAFQQTAGGELASLLPRVAQRLAEQADEASTAGEVDKSAGLVEKATATLELIGNTKYVPKSLRDDGELAVTRELIERIGRRGEAMKDLADTLDSMARATGSGQIDEAYKTHSAFVARRPELRDDTRLAEALGANAEAEKQSVRFVEERVSAETGERESPLTRSVALSNRRLEGSTGARGIYTATSGGVLYAVSTDDGRLLWRRPVGFATRPIYPTPVGGDLLVVDHRHNELLRLNERDGALKWRAPLPGGVAQPSLIDSRAFVATESGALLVLDAVSGERLGRIQFAQRLTTPPVADPSGNRLHQAGDQSSLYTLDLTTLDCTSVRHLGHAPGSIEAAPVVTGSRLLLIENVGAETAMLRSFALDAQGEVTEQNDEFRLDGVTSDRPVLAGRRVLVAVDTGQVSIFEVNAGPNQTAMVRVASRPTTRRENGPRYLEEVAGEIWIGETGLMRSTPSLSDGRLVGRQITDAMQADRFVAPLAKQGRTLLHARSPQSGGLTFGATDTRTGKLVWETAVATPPLGAPEILRRPQGIVMTTTAGELHFITRDALRRQLSDPPSGVADKGAPFTHTATFGSGARVLASSAEKAFAIASAEAGVKQGRLTSRLACAPAAMGEGWLAPLEVGQVALVDSGGEEIAIPFQPEVTPGSEVFWLAPGVGEAGGEQVAVLADDNDTVYCLALERGALRLRSSHRLAGLSPSSRSAVADGHAALGVTGNKLAVFGAPDLGAPKVIEMPSTIAWGPHAAGNLILVADQTGQLMAVDPASGPAVVWKKPLGKRRLVGDPLTREDELIVVTDNGVVERVAVASGETLQQIDLGQALATGATAYGSRLLVGAADSAVLIVNTQ